MISFLLGTILYAAALSNPRPITNQQIEMLSQQWDADIITVVNAMKFCQSVNKPIVSFLGGHKVQKTDPYYKAAYQLAERLAEEGCLIASGGGEGIMDAANCGANSVKNQQNTNIAIEVEGVGAPNPCAQKRIILKSYFARKWLLLEQASALVFFPGGIGTLDELVTILNLIDSNIDRQIPIYVMDKAYWKQIQSWIAEALKMGLIKKETVALAIFSDSTKEVEEGILNRLNGKKSTSPLGKGASSPH